MFMSFCSTYGCLGSALFIDFWWSMHNFSPFFSLWRVFKGGSVRFVLPSCCTDYTKEVTAHWLHEHQLASITVASITTPNGSQVPSFGPKSLPLLSPLSINTPGLGQSPCSLDQDHAYGVLSHKDKWPDFLAANSPAAFCCCPQTASGQPSLLSSLPAALPQFQVLHPDLTSSHQFPFPTSRRALAEQRYRAKAVRWGLGGWECRESGSIEMNHNDREWIARQAQLN